MKQFKIINSLTGWLAFAIAAFTYCMTVEPTASFWDCPEFITTAFKLEVGHPPGAPFFMLTGNFFTQFTDDPTKVALCVNIMSALLSALCILFLFWSITHLTRKLICKDGAVENIWQTILIMAAGLTGALAYTWSDTFWFSAVEGEVYAYSSMFTALVFWLILKWEDVADEPHSDRWLVLIFYLTGLSIGVHLLNLLCLPAIVLVYYFKKNPQATAKGSLMALAISAMLVVAVLYGVVPGIVKVGGWFERFFVNSVGMPFNSGLIIYILVLITVVLAAIWSTTTNRRGLIIGLYTASVTLLGIPFFAGRSTMAFIIGLLVISALIGALMMKYKGEFLLRKRFLNTSLLCMLMLMIGYSSYAVIVIRSTQNTPMDQNSPEDIFSLGTYLSREQYGDTPLLYGPAFSSEKQYQYDPAENAYMYMFTKDTKMQRHEKKTADEPDRYDEMEQMGGYIYPSGAKMLFPRIHSSAHAGAYQQWLGGIETHTVQTKWKDDRGNEMEAPCEMPSQIDNLKFFMAYQVNYMYWRYFLWNFAGRQNDIQGHGEPEHGNWISGIPFIDNMLYGDQDLLSQDLKDNKGHNVFYCLPLILGLIGLFWQAFRGQRGVQQFWVVFFLFFMTGLAIVLYLNQTPQQPRERDYAYAGSFYAFAIWIGIGVAAIGTWLKQLLKDERAAVPIASVLGILVPLQMVSQTWDDHDRSGRYACRDFGLNYLNTLPEEGMPIIFTNGDNDTFPLWYAQDTEGQRTDARVCNLSYLQTDWYTDQMCRPAYNSAALPISWSRYEYVDNRGKGFDHYEVRPEMRAELDKIKAETGVNTYDLTYIIDHYIRERVRNDQPGIFPTDSVVIKVDREAVRRSGMMIPAGDTIPEYMPLVLRGRHAITKCQMMIYEMVARSAFRRPIYMSYTLGRDNMAGLENNLVLEGLAYRLTPFNNGGRVVIDTNKMYDNLMKRFRYGNVSAPGIYLDETVTRMCTTHRHLFTTLVKQLLAEGKKDKALKALQKCKKELPASNIPYSDADSQLPALWLQVGQKQEAARVAKALAQKSLSYLRWASTLSETAIANRVQECYIAISNAYDALDVLDVASPKEAGQINASFNLLSNSPAVSAVNSWVQEQQMQQQMQNQPALNLEGMGGSNFGL